MEVVLTEKQKGCILVSFGLQPSFVIQDKALDSLSRPHFPPVYTRLCSQGVPSPLSQVRCSTKRQAYPQSSRLRRPHPSIQLYIQRSTLVLPVSQEHVEVSPQSGQTMRHARQTPGCCCLPTITPDEGLPNTKCSWSAMIRHTKWNKSDFWTAGLPRALICSCA